MSKMETREYQVSFTTPAFLGNAEQNAQWRTPPFKALLRQWWRVAYAAKNDFKLHSDEMRHAEGLLFGHAWLKDDVDKRGTLVASRKSEVRIRLDRWDVGKLKKDQWKPMGSVKHPEVNFPVGSDLYLGYGPITLPKGMKGPQLKANAAIQQGELASLSLAVPKDHAFLIEHALWLMDRYGTLGGRSRNGWGSFSLIPQADDKGVPTFQSAIPKGVFRTWDSALELDWPHAIGLDDSGAPLVWQTRPFDDWKVMMRELAMIKIGLRTQFAFPNEKPPHMRIELRHWLSYPVTKHPTKKWKGSARLPNSLRFKARPDNDYPQKVRGVVYHMPCLPPPEFSPQPEQIKLVWRQVHAFLDAHDQLERISV